jgi:hypothetical protein
MRVYKQCVAVLALAGAFGLCGSASLRAAVVHHVIAARGNPTPAGGTFITLARPQLNSSGQVAFYGGVNNDFGFQEVVFLYDDTAGAALAVPGGAAPEGGNYSGFNADSVRLNETGQVVYRAELTGGFSYRGFFRHDGTTATAVAVNFAPTPAGGVYDGITDPVLNDSGQVVFRSQLLGASSSLGMFRYDGPTTTTIALAGAPAPSGGNYGIFSSDYEMNASGQIVVHATLSDGSSSEGIFRLDGEADVAVALRGTPAPGGGVYSNLHPPLISSSGDVVYGAQLQSDGFDPGALFRYTDATGSTAIVRPGDPAPGGGTIESAGPIALNSSGQILYSANMSGGLHDTGIFRHDGAVAHTVALLNTAAPGTTATFFSEFVYYETIHMNEDGIVVLEAELVGAGVTEANDHGYWYGTDASNLQLLVREGDQILVNGTNRTLRRLPDNLDGFSISDTGIAWVAEFTDNTVAVIHTTFASLPGDFNQDGAVDAADYVVWRKGLGDGTYTQDDYNTWRANFGAPATGAAAAAHSPLPFAVPEPATSVLMLLTAAGCPLAGVRAAGKPR